MKIATIITCFNRKEKTLKCLTSLFHALDIYNSNAVNKIELSIYLTDDGCTDGTCNAIRSSFNDKDITILQGTGNLFWAGGMRFAWKEALQKHDEWDFYLLLNDDTFMKENCFFQLLDANCYSQIKYKMQGIYSGVTCDIVDNNKITYGGCVWKNYLLGTTIPLIPNGIPQKCDKANANILLVSKFVVNTIGIFWDGYTHIGADYDYSLQCNKHKIPVLITSEICGFCEYDHRNPEEEKEKVLSMTLNERRAYFNHPLHPDEDRLKFKKRNTPLRYPIGVIGRFLNLYFPKIYYFLDKLR